MHFIYPRQWTKRRASVMKNDHPPFVLALDDASATLDTVGGKGASLARMAAAGLPVPPGFHITTAAYRHFVAANELQRAILAAVAATKADDPATLEEAARQIGRLFAQRAMPDEIAEDRKSTRLNSSHTVISYAVFCLKKKKKKESTKKEKN